jgi:hypothetical protein
LQVTPLDMSILVGCATRVYRNVDGTTLLGIGKDTIEFNYWLISDRKQGS